MRRSLIRLGAALAGLISSLVLVVLALAADKSKAEWVRDDFASFGVDRIGMLPVATFDNSLETERIVQSSVAAALKGAGYRWLSAPATRALIKTGEGGDSLLKVLREDILENVQLDSTLATTICERLRIDAVLTVRVDQWEKREIEWNESGKPSTTVHIQAALVDSSGVLLWRVDGNETVEGLYRQAVGSDVIGVKGSGLGLKAVTGSGGAPGYEQALEPLVKRWADSFPAKPEASSPATEH